MDDFDFLEALSEPLNDGEALLKKLKTAGISDSLGLAARAAKAYAGTHKPELAGALLGAGIAAGLHLAANRSKDGLPSAQQRLGSKAVREAEETAAQAKEEGRPLTFREDLSRASASALKGFSDVTTRHPVKSVMIALPAGAAAGWRLAKVLK